MEPKIIKMLQVPDSIGKPDTKTTDTNTTVSLQEFKKKQVINWVLKNSKSF